MKFQKGQSGNPAGKPRGAKDRRTELRALFQPRSGELVNKAIEMALSGDAACLRLCIDRLVAPIKAQDTAAPIEGLDAGSLADQGRAVMAGVAAGTLTPDQAATLLHAIASQAKIIEVDELEQRIARLEERASGAS